MPGPYITQKAGSLGWCVEQGFPILPRARSGMWTFWIHLVRKSQNAQQDVWLLHHFCVLLTTCACSCSTKMGWKKIWQKIPSVTWHLSKSSALVKVTFNLAPFYCISLIDFIILPWVASLPSGSLQVHSCRFTSSTMGAVACQIRVE